MRWALGDLDAWLVTPDSRWDERDKRPFPEVKLRTARPGSAAWLVFAGPVTASQQCELAATTPLTQPGASGLGRLRPQPAARRRPARLFTSGDCRPPLGWLLPAHAEVGA
jgi:hypothetical protein